MSQYTTFPCKLKTPHNAFYDTSKQTLKISIEGTTDLNIVGIHLQQDRWLGGLKFSVLGMYNGVPGPTPKNFSANLDFPVSLPNRAYPSDSILIASGESPNGEPFKILYGGLKPPGDKNGVSKTTGSNGAKSTSSNGATTMINTAEVGDNSHLGAGGPIGSVLPPIRVIAVEGRPIQVKEHACVGTNDGIEAKFDDKSLEMTDARICGKDIVWTFKPKSGFLGTTLVNVETSILPTMSFTPYTKVQGYIVDVVVLSK